MAPIVYSKYNQLETLWKPIIKNITIQPRTYVLTNPCQCPQYVKQKRHKYGIKILKLCRGSGYTYAFRVYTGQTLENEFTTPTNIVMSLCKDLFDKGHTLYIDNWYTSLELADKLINKNTHIVGTLRSNRRGNSHQVISTKLKRGEIVAKENNQGMTILKEER